MALDVERAPLVVAARPLSGCRRRNMVASALSVLVYVVAYGMVTSYSAPATMDMKRAGSRFEDVTEDQIAWIASLPALGAVVGNAVSGYLTHRLGRKAALMYVTASFTVSWLAIAYAPDMGFVYTGRLVSGFCAGVCAVAVPAYVVEVSSVEIRGLLAAGFQTAFALGVLLVVSLGTVLRWSWLAVSGACVVVVGGALTSLVPESPAWLMRAERNAEAFQGLRFLRRDYHEAAREFQEISDQLAEEPGVRIQLRDPSLYKPFGIAVALMLFQQFCGINALMSYSVELLHNLAVTSSLDPWTAASLVALVQVLATGVSCALMDKAGRRTLYIASGICVTFSLCASGAYSFFYERDPSQLARWSWVPLVSFVTYIASFSLGLGPVPFVVTPEMVPSHLRSFLLSVAQVSSSSFSFVATKTFNDLRAVVGLSGLYWTYASFALLGTVFYWACIPETKGRTIRDIHRSFQPKTLTPAATSAAPCNNRF